MQETPLGTLTPKLRERFHLLTNITAVIITVCSCILIVVIAVCVKKSTLAWMKVKSKILTSSNRVNHEHHEITEPVNVTISDTGDSFGEMQVDNMTNNVAYKSVQFTSSIKLFTSEDIRMLPEMKRTYLS